MPMNLKILIMISSLLAGFHAYGQLPLPQVPATLTRPADRADYIAAHFYDEMNWNDTVMTVSENITQDWANFLSVLPHCSPDGRDSAIVSMVRSIPETFVPVYADMADGYLFATDSELCDEETYLRVLRALSAHPAVSEAYKSGLKSRYEYLSRCAPGTAATDITVESPDGLSTCKLESLKGRSPNILLVFYDPDCEDCHAVLEELSAGSYWKSLVDSGQLMVVRAEITDEIDALYPILTVPSLYHLSGTSLEVLSRNITLQELNLIP